jgi:outer membrane murein-binding lipoprotein Lpp
MKTAPYDGRRYYLVRATTLVVIGCIWLAGCATHTTKLKQEVEVLLKQTMDEVRQETGRIDTEMAQMRSELVRLRSEVGQVDSKVDGLGSQVSQVGSEVALLQTDVQKNDSSLVGLAVRVNQLDRRVASSDTRAPQNGQRTSGPQEAVAGQQFDPAVTTAPLPVQREEMPKTLKHGMSQQDVLRLFGDPYRIERILDAIYWYYGDGDLKGEYVRFNAASGQVNGWSSLTPQAFQIDLRRTQGGLVR